MGAFLLLPTTLPVLMATIGSYSLELQLMIHVGKALLPIGYLTSSIYGACTAAVDSKGT